MPASSLFLVLLLLLLGIALTSVDASSSTCSIYGRPDVAYDAANEDNVLCPFATVQNYPGHACQSYSNVWPLRQRCETNQDCYKGDTMMAYFACVNSKCLYRSRLIGETCEGDGECFSGKCDFMSGKCTMLSAGDQCFQDEPNACPQGTACIDNTCQAKNKQVTESCMIGYSQLWSGSMMTMSLPVSNCAAGLVCNYGTCQVPSSRLVCQSPADCIYDNVFRYCNPSNNTCQDTPQGLGESCENGGICAPGLACDPNKGYKCSALNSLSIGESCSYTAQCQEGAFCRQGICTQIGVSCNTDDDCATGGDISTPTACICSNGTSSGKCAVIGMDQIMAIANPEITAYYECVKNKCGQSQTSMNGYPLDPTTCPSKCSDLYIAYFKKQLRQGRLVDAGFMIGSMPGYDPTAPEPQPSPSPSVPSLPKVSSSQPTPPIVNGATTSTVIDMMTVAASMLLMLFVIDAAF